jgi:predicted amidohydrolase
MEVHLCQLDSVWENRTASHERARRLLDAAKPGKDSLIVLPEMFSTGFSTNLSVTCQTAAREDESFLRALAREYRSTVMGGVVFPAPGGKGFNQSVTFDPAGNEAARYSKIQPFLLGAEGKCHDPGSRVCTFALGQFTVAPFVCYDLRFPEHFRTAVKMGADLMVVIASWPVKRYHHWLTLLQARAIENLAFVIGVNRTGADPNFLHNGRSVVVSPHGHIIADAGEAEQVLSARIEAEVAQQWRQDFPALRDMRQD